MKFVLLFASIIFIVSCSKNLTPFSQKLYDKYQWSEQELKQIQFYLSEDLILHKKSDANEATISDGSVKLTRAYNGQKIKINKGTPGVLLFAPKSNRFAISFSSSNDEKYLMFGPNDQLGGNYALLAKDWDKMKGVVTYENVEYEVYAQDAYCTLMIDIKKAAKYNYNLKTEGGRRIGKVE